MSASDDVLGRGPADRRAASEPPARSAGASRLAGALRHGAHVRSTTPYFEAMGELREAAVDYVLELKALGVSADRVYAALRALAASALGPPGGGKHGGVTGTRAERASHDVREALSAQVVRWAMATYYRAD